MRGIVSARLKRLVYYRPWPFSAPWARSISLKDLLTRALVGDEMLPPHLRSAQDGQNRTDSASCGEAWPELPPGVTQDDIIKASAMVNEAAAALRALPTQWCAKCLQWTVPEVATVPYIAGVVSAHYYACPFCGMPTYEEIPKEEDGLAPDSGA